MCPSNINLDWDMSLQRNRDKSTDKKVKKLHKGFKEFTKFHKGDIFHRIEEIDGHKVGVFEYYPVGSYFGDYAELQLFGKESGHLEINFKTHSIFDVKKISGFSFQPKKKLVVIESGGKKRKFPLPNGGE